jgi:hypothetical protein
VDETTPCIGVSLAVKHRKQKRREWAMRRHSLVLSSGRYEFSRRLFHQLCRFIWRQWSWRIISGAVSEDCPSETAIKHKQHGLCRRALQKSPYFRNRDRSKTGGIVTSHGAVERRRVYSGDGAPVGITLVGSAWPTLHGTCI